MNKEPFLVSGIRTHDLSQMLNLLSKDVSLINEVLACDHILHSCQLQRSNEVLKVIPLRAFFSTPSRLEEIQEEGSCGCPESWTQA